MPTPPRLSVAQRAAPQPAALEVERLLSITAREAERAAELAWRTALSAGAGPVQRIVLPGPTTRPWKHTGSIAVGVWGLVTRAGALGATVAIEGEVTPADTPGGRTRVFPVAPNESLEINVDAGVTLTLFVATPEAAVSAS